jgi:predicted RNA-binding Zn-ribbon protein involved in translation (DUF1610 family)
MLTALLFLLPAHADDAAAALALAQAQRQRLAIKAPEPKPAPAITVNVQPQQYRTVSGHYHYCPKCRKETIFHTHSSKGKVEDHICPECGYGPIWQINQHGPVRIPVKVQPSKPVATFTAAPPCPT